MTEDAFWEMIEAAKRDEERDKSGPEGHAAKLAARLAALPVEEVVSFQGWFEYLIDRAFTGATHGAHMLITDGDGSDDGFLYFRSWLVGQGEVLYKSSLADPDLLADRLHDGDDPAAQTEGELLRYAATYACRAKTGLDDGDEAWPLDDDTLERLVSARHSELGTSGDRGDWIDETDLPRRLPKLATRCEALWSKAPWRPRGSD